MLRLAVGPREPPIQRVLEAFSLEVQRPCRDAKYSHPSSADIRKSGAVPSLPDMPSWRLHGQIDPYTVFNLQ